MSLRFTPRRRGLAASKTILIQLLWFIWQILNIISEEIIKLKWYLDPLNFKVDFLKTSFFRVSRLVLKSDHIYILLTCMSLYFLYTFLDLSTIILNTIICGFMNKIYW